MTDDLRALLTEVAAGRVAPADAARRIDDLPADAGDPTGDAGFAAPPQPPAPPGPTPPEAAGPSATSASSDDVVTLVRVQSSARPVRLIADPAVATLTVDGPHTVRREGGTVVVDALPGDGAGAGAGADGSYRYERKTGFSRWIAQATMVGVPMTVRVHPDLAIEAEVMAGSLDVNGLRGPLGFSVTAGSLRADDCSGTIRGVVRAGSAKITARPTAGESSLRVESGSVVLRLQPGSDVRLRARAELGEIQVDGHHSKGSSMRADAPQEVVVGSGTATFEIDVVMGSAKVTTK